MKANFYLKFSLLLTILCLPIWSWGQVSRVTTFAGSTTEGYANGNRLNARFYAPFSIVINSANEMFVADYFNACIRKISPNGTVSTFAGYRSGRPEDTLGSPTVFNPTGLAIDSIGNIYLADQGNQQIKKITPEGVVSIIAGSGVMGFANGNALEARFNNPKSVAVDRQGNVYVTDMDNNRIRKISPLGIVSTLAGSGAWGNNNGQGTAAQFHSPQGICIDRQGNLYVTDAYNSLIRKITPGGLVSVVASRGGGILTGIAVDALNNLYVSDISNNDVVKISPNGTVTNLAGSGIRGYRDSTAAIAEFNLPEGLCLDRFGNVFVADASNNTIRLISTYPTPPKPTISGVRTFCHNSYTTLTSSAQRGNRWSTGDTTRSINVNEAGNYNVAVSENGCLSALSDTFRVVSRSPNPTTITYFTGSVNCLGSQVQLTPEGNYSFYQWSTGETTRSIDVWNSGEYSVRVGNAYNCLSLPSEPALIEFDTNWCSVQVFREGTDSITANLWADSYIWYLDGMELLTSNTRKTIAIQGNGVYTFRAINGGRTSRPSNPIIITSANQNINAPKVKVYPNPATGKVSITTSTDAETVTFRNPIGQLVFTTKAQPNMELNLSSFAKGMYLVQVIGKEGITTERLVIQ